METIKTIENKYPKMVVLTEQDPEGMYLTFSQYIDRRFAADLKRDPLCIPLTHSSLLKVIRRGEMEVYIQGERKFIDWNKYHNFLFARFTQTAKVKKEK